jgi:hypothetical protein
LPELERREGARTGVRDDVIHVRQEAGARRFGMHVDVRRKRTEGRRVGSGAEHDDEPRNARRNRTNDRAQDIGALVEYSAERAQRGRPCTAERARRRCRRNAEIRDPRADAELIRRLDMWPMGVADRGAERPFTRRKAQVQPAKRVIESAGLRQPRELAHPSCERPVPLLANPALEPRAARREHERYAVLFGDRPPNGLEIVAQDHIRPAAPHGRVQIEEHARLDFGLEKRRQIRERVMGRRTPPEIRLPPLRPARLEVEPVHCEARARTLRRREHGLMTLRGWPRRGESMARSARARASC